MLDKMEKTLVEIRQQKPLILCLTNFVTMEFVANSLLSLGAAPIMSVCEDELAELLKTASALYVNIGTLDHHFIALTQKALEIATEHNKPIIFDPVGSGATTIRTETAKSIAPFARLIRGNSSEIIALSDNTHSTYGVDANHTPEEAECIARQLSLDHNAIVVVSGPVDRVTNGDQSIQVPFGSHLMKMVTGMGCSLTAVIATFQSVLEDSFESAVMAAHYFALCGQVASQVHTTPGAFKIAFLDQLHKPDFVLMRDVYDSRR